MKRISIALFLIWAGTFCASAQQIITYSLPSTTLHLKVTAVKEQFVAGPYARYAQKYLGAEARTADAVTYRLKSVEMTPRSEACPAESRTVDLARLKDGGTAFLSFCREGLVVTTGGKPDGSGLSRFPAPASEGLFDDKDLGENLTHTTTTLYKPAADGSTFSRVAVQQSEVVEKSLENKAAEAAQRIFDLRRSRVQIITGDTDATFSGEAMGAAIAEITRIEQEYLTLFFGLTETSEQTMHFDVVPEAGREPQMYIAFRLSDTEGLLPEDNIAGRPFVLQLSVESRMADTPKEEAPEESAAKKRSASAADWLHYRVPAIVTARLMDAGVQLFQSRIPVYQLGTECTFPLTLKK